MKKRAAGVGTIQAFKEKELLNFLTLKPNNEWCTHVSFFFAHFSWEDFLYNFRARERKI